MLKLQEELTEEKPNHRPLECYVCGLGLHEPVDVITESYDYGVWEGLEKSGITKDSTINWRIDYQQYITNGEKVYRGYHDACYLQAYSD